MTTHMPPVVVTGLEGFAALLRMIRLMARWSGKDAAHALRVGQPLIYKREMGQLHVKVDAADQHLRVFGYRLVVMHTEDLRRLGINDPTPAQAAELAHLTAATDALSAPKT